MNSTDFVNGLVPQFQGNSVKASTQARRPSSYGPLGYHQQVSSLRHGPIFAPNRQLIMVPDTSSKVQQTVWTQQMLWPYSTSPRLPTEQNFHHPFDCHHPMCPECNLQTEAIMHRYTTLTPQQGAPPTHPLDIPARQGLFASQSFVRVPMQSYDQQTEIHHPQPQYHHQFLHYRPESSLRSFQPDSSAGSSHLDPAEVFLHSPAPTLSNCSTRSISSEFPSGVGPEIDNHLIYHANPDYSGAEVLDKSSVLHSKPLIIKDHRRIRELTSDTILDTSQLESISSSPSPPPPQTDDESYYSSNSSRCNTCSPSPGPGSQQQRVVLASHRRKDKVARRVQESRSKDELLVLWKNQGLSYREIKEKGRFSEAESTLRGRYRSLTKAAEQRVRKPRWTKRDIALLRRAVNHLSNPIVASISSQPAGSRRSKRPIVSRPEVIKFKTPWKEVAHYIIDNGGTYLFGNATCRKKWDEIAARDAGHGRCAYDETEEHEHEVGGDDYGEEEEEYEESETDKFQR